MIKQDSFFFFFCFSAEGRKDKNKTKQNKTKKTKSEFEHRNGKRKKITFYNEQIVIQTIRVFMNVCAISVEKATHFFFFLDFGLPINTNLVNICINVLVFPISLHGIYIHISVAKIIVYNNLFEEFILKSLVHLTAD